MVEVAHLFDGLQEELRVGCFPLLMVRRQDVVRRRCWVYRTGNHCVENGAC